MFQTCICIFCVQLYYAHIVNFGPFWKTWSTWSIIIWKELCKYSFKSLLLLPLNIISACGFGMPRGFPFNELSSMFNSSACPHCWFITLFLLWKGCWVNEFLTLMKRVTWICSQHVYSMGRSLRRPLGRSHMTGNGLRNVIDICCLQWGLICVHTHTHTHTHTHLGLVQQSWFYCVNCDIQKWGHQFESTLPN